MPLETPEFLNILLNKFKDFFEEVLKATEEFEEKTNCEIEVLKSEVNSLKVENNKLKDNGRGRFNL